jgi:AcrR family transcriptional regulator
MTPERRTAAGEGLGQPCDDRRARILAAAMDAFARDGFDGTSVRSIARVCGLSDAGVFYYFPTKRHILEALWHGAPMGSFPAAEPGAPLTRERLRQLIVATMQISAENFTFLRLVARQALRSDATAVALRNASRARWRTALFEHFRCMGPRAGMLVDLFMASVTGHLIRLEMETGDDYPNAALDEREQDRIVSAVERLLPLRLEAGPLAPPA